MAQAYTDSSDLDESIIEFILKAGFGKKRFDSPRLCIEGVKT